MIHILNLFPSLSLYFLLNFQSTNGILQLNAASKNEEIIKQCLLNIVSTVTTPGDVLALFRNNSYPYLFSNLVHEEKLCGRWSFMHNTGTDTKLSKLSGNYLKENIVNMFLIQIRSPEELELMLKNLKTYYIFNPRVNFLITSTTGFENMPDALSLIFDSLWMANVYNILVVLPSKLDATKTNLYTWFPYGMSRCGNGFAKHIRIGQCLDGQLSTVKTLYPNKIPNKLTSCPVKVRTVVWPPFVLDPVKRISNSDEFVFKRGFEIVLLNTIAKSMHLNVTYTLSEKTINWGEIYGNGTATGLQAYLLENEGDLGVSSQAFTEDRLKFFDVGVPYFFEHLIWCVPHAETIPAWQKIVDVFTFGSWMLALVAYVLVTLAIWCMSRLSSSEGSTYKIIPNCVQNSFGALVGVTIFSVPKSNSVRILFLFWLIFTLHLNSVYKTSLVSMLTSPMYERQMHNLEDILHSDLRLQFLAPMKRYFHLTDQNNVSKRILERWIDCVDLKDCMDRVAYTRDSIMLLPKLYLKFVQRTYKKSSHASYIYCFNGKIATYPGSMLMRKGFPLRDRMNQLIYRAISGGLVKFWQKNALRINYLTFNKTSIFGYGENNKAITLKEQQPAFVCLIAGLLVATAVFVCEVAFSEHYQAPLGSSNK